MKTPKIIFEDDYLAVIDKPSGWVVNRSGTVSDVTLQDFVEETIAFKNAPSESDFVRRSGLVHRLDKETSGIILCAKDEKTFLFLQQQFKARSVEKIYIALCHGRMKMRGEVDAPIGRLPKNRRKFGVIAGGRPALTKYECKSIYEHPDYPEGLSLIQAYPKTGRTHQIRVHMKYINHPVFSDSLYVGRKMIRLDHKHVQRHFLHAAKITLMHPNGNKVNFESELPAELFAFVSTFA